MRWCVDPLAAGSRRAGWRCGRRRRRAARHVAPAPGCCGSARYQRGEQVDAVADRPAACLWRLAPELVVPVDDAAVGDRARLDASSPWPGRRAPSLNSSSRIHCSRTGRPGGARQQRGVERHVVGAVVAVAAGAFGVDAADRAAAACRAPWRGRARSGKTPWLWVQTVSLPSLNSATAQDGPIEACA